MTTTTETRTEHTPGPWTVSPDGVCIVSADTEYRTHTNEDGKEFQHPDKLIALPYGCGAHGSRDANARLIAAAPDLLAALVALREAVTDAYKAGHIPAEPFVAAGNVIAEAIGR